jgi:Uma2 family endonuclease
MLRPSQRVTAEFTYEDYLALPDDGKHYEVIEGDLLMTPAPFVPHQRVLGVLYRLLADHVEPRGLGEVFIAPVDVVLDKRNIVEPDLVFVSKKRRSIVGDRIMGPPDLVVEIVSKGTKTRDKVTKRALYERKGVKHAWILDPFDRTLEENVLQRKRYARRSKLSGNAVFAPACFPGLEIPLKKVWGS